MLVRGIEADVLPTTEQVRHGRHPVESAGGRVAEREVPQGCRGAASRTAASGYPAGTTCRRPENQRKLDAADALGRLADEAGMSLVHMAIAFVLQHPAVTAPIIGPRTMDHLESQLGAAEVTLSAGSARPDRRDRAARYDDQSDVDRGYLPPELTDPFPRRRRTA